MNMLPRKRCLSNIELLGVIYVRFWPRPCKNAESIKGAEIHVILTRHC